MLNISAVCRVAIFSIFLAFALCTVLTFRDYTVFQSAHVAPKKETLILMYICHRIKVSTNEVLNKLIKPRTITINH